jgi:hypothetical protein
MGQKVERFGSCLRHPGPAPAIRFRGFSRILFHHGIARQARPNRLAPTASRLAKGAIVMAFAITSLR